MKKSILITAASAFLAGTLLFTGCTTPAEKVENAKDNVTEAKEDLAEAEKAYLADLAEYRNDAAIKITRNNDRIAAFTVSIESERKEAKAAYKKKLAAFEQENTDLKRRLDDYQASGQDNWESFKIEFSRDLDRLGKALSDLTDNNVR